MALLVVVVGAASATDSGEPPMVVSADGPGSLGVVSTAQSDTETNPESETERRLVGRESSERVDGVVIALWSIAAGMTVMLVVFLWHTSPRRRLRLARRRSTQLYDGEADQAEDAAGAGPAADAEAAEDADDAAAAAKQDADSAVDSGSGGPVLPAVAEEPEVAGPELPPVWEDEAETDEAEPANEEAEPGDGGPTNEPPAARKAAGEGWSGFWARLRHTLGLD